ncbi:hypothetical protein RSAG8_10792, partial [Rhizoctonia solani AG-8 WAC10335]
MDAYGADVENTFDDMDSIPQGAKVSVVTIRAGKRIDSIAFTLGSQILEHGGTGGELSSFPIDPTDYVKNVRVCWGEARGSTRIFLAGITTHGKRVFTVGTETDKCAEYSTDEGYGIVGTFGKAGDEVDRLGFLSIKQ